MKEIFDLPSSFSITVWLINESLRRYTRLFLKKLRLLVCRSGLQLSLHWNEVGNSKTWKLEGYYLWSSQWSFRLGTVISEADSNLMRRNKERIESNRDGWKSWHRWWWLQYPSCPQVFKTPSAKCPSLIRPLSWEKNFMQNHCIMMPGMNEGQKEKHNTEKKIGLGPMLGISDAKPSVRLAPRPVSQWRKDVGY